jgi:hypothetical protein
MPAPMKEYRCAVHGPFESRARQPHCPQGCDGSMVYWSPRTPPSIRTNGVMTGMDALQYRVAAEQGLSDMRSKYEGESVADHRPRAQPTGSFATPQEYLGQIAQGMAPPGAVWGSPAAIGLRAPTSDDRGKITPTADAWAGRPPPKIPTIQFNKPDPSERAKVAELAQKADV